MDEFWDLWPRVNYLRSIVNSLLLDLEEGRSNPGVSLELVLPMEPGKVEPISLTGFSLLSTLFLMAGLMMFKASSCN